MRFTCKLRPASSKYLSIPVNAHALSLLFFFNSTSTELFIIFIIIILVTAAEHFKPWPGGHWFKKLSISSISEKSIQITFGSTSFEASSFICIGWKLIMNISAQLLAHDVISIQQYRDIGKKTEQK